MSRYAYAFHYERDGDEVLIRFGRFPEIISAIARTALKGMSDDEIESHAHDAVVTALQGIILTRGDVPAADDPARRSADGFVRLSVGESMKLELFKLYKANCTSIADFARRIGKPETAARRLLDLTHRSRSSEIERAIEAFGKRLVHDWALEPAPRIRTERSASSAARRRSIGMR